MAEDAPPQRRRPVLGVSGWLLFVCLFLPTVRVCGEPTAPIEFPPTYGVYAGALAIGVAAVSRSLRARRIVHGLVIGLAIATAITWGLLFLAGELGATPLLFVAIPLGLAATIYAAVISARAAWTPRGLAIGWALHALVASAWNTLLTLDPERMWGAAVALAASGLMLVDALIAVSSEHAEVVRRREERRLPVARVIGPPP